MKKLIIITAIICIAATCIAADIIITIRIPEDKVPAFRRQFFASVPIPLVYNEAFETDPNAIEMVPQYTEKQYVKKVLIDYIFRILKVGRARLAAQLVEPTDPNMVK